MYKHLAPGTVNVPQNIDRWTGKENVAHTHNGILLCHRKEQILLLARKGMHLGAIMLSEIMQTEKAK